MNYPEFTIDLWLLARSAPHAQPLITTVEEFGDVYSGEYFWACDFFQRYQQLDTEYFQGIFEENLPKQVFPIANRGAVLDPARQRSVEALLREVFPNGIDL